nr:TonB-dependent receptor [Chenggangzhangella methanolivorans]
MDDLGAQKADEATRYSAGVFSQPFGDDTDTNWFYIRGFDATQTGVYRDGMQLYSYAFGNFYQDTYLVERVEVLRGASASLYGGGNIGGIINYVSKRPLDADFSQVEVGIDNYPTAFAAFDVNKVIPNDLVTKGPAAAGLEVPRHRQARGRRRLRQARGRHPRIPGRGDLYAERRHRHRLRQLHPRQNHGSGDFLPYYGTVKDATSADGTINLGKIGRKTNFTDPDLDDHDRRQFMVGYELNHDIDDVWTVNTKARFAYSHLKEQLLYPFGYGFAARPSAGNTQLARINFAHDTETFSFTTDNNLVGKFSTGGIDHTLLMGLDYKMYYIIDEVQASSIGTSVDIHNPDLNQPQPSSPISTRPRSSIRPAPSSRTRPASATASSRR